MTLPLGWRTDVAVRRLSGAQVDEHSDHLVVRTPADPAYHWGNFVLVTDPAAVDDAGRWLRTFEAEFPAADHRAVGLVAEPQHRIAWAAADMVLEHEDVLASSTGPVRRPLAAGYEVRPAASRRVAPASSAFFGAYAGGRLAASLGIVDCGDGIARYQEVRTEPEHRRRGLASHLLGVAADWAAERGCRQWVILADTDSDAGRLYRSLGFGFVQRSTQAYRGPGRTRVPAAGAVILDEDGRVLLVQRGREPERGRWSIPGGRVEAGESLRQAVVREVLEETGLVVEVHEELWSLTRPAGEDRAYEIHDFRASVRGGELRPGDDADDVRWVRPDELRELPLTEDLSAWLARAGVGGG